MSDESEPSRIRHDQHCRQPAPRPPRRRAFGQAPAVMTPSPQQTGRHLVGQRQQVQERRGRNLCGDGVREDHARASDVLDALIAGVNIVELDPEDDSVGYGGLPNAEGVVQLDSCCMHGPKKRAGGVAALEGVRTPSLVARAVMEQTDHHLIVGKGAQEFARRSGSRSKTI